MKTRGKFPTDPLEGELHTPPGGPSYVFSRLRWQLVSELGSRRPVRLRLPPAPPVARAAPAPAPAPTPRVYPATLVLAVPKVITSGDIDFPDNPVVGQRFTAPSGITYVYDGTVWAMNTTGSGEEGPAGPPGPTGPTGPAGPSGSPDTAAQVLAKLVTVDGTGSTLDADLLDGQHGPYYLDWLNQTNKPATFPPTLPIPQSGVTNLIVDLADRVRGTVRLTVSATAPPSPALNDVWIDIS